MTFTQHYDSPLGIALLAADEIGLTGLWFEGQNYFSGHLPAEHIEQENPILAETKRWLDIYFAGSQPDFCPPLHPTGSACGKCSCRFPMGRPQPMGRLRGSLQKSGG